ncbi:hypothetical protein BOTBODRAFT_102035 [Botryobasidium botryosum FD-172 SS1]|uniref:Uncharacterized protein n=1 Tax=Botryobasidium botryosum (strain FD-172 SS1) TaxID=930990 RepID=A0A067MWV5_BOTB1|nr:hypothetical protein BOTBODRAFT_102035 [Botryobasidium botryosum FD-172 SS1]
MCESLGSDSRGSNAVCSAPLYSTNRAHPLYPKDIVRLLFMVPVYAIVTFISYLFYTHASPIVLIRDSYEAVIISAFFYLLLEYIGSAPYHQKEVFRREVDMTHFSWVFPMGWVKWTPDDGFYFLQLMKWGVLQYCVLRPLSTLISVILNAMGLYCEDSWSLGWGHIYVCLIIACQILTWVYCLIQFYMPISGQLAPYKPLLKFFAVKAVIFLTFWQSVILSLLSTAGVIKDVSFPREYVWQYLIKLLCSFPCLAKVHVSEAL